MYPQQPNAPEINIVVNPLMYSLLDSDAFCSVYIPFTVGTWDFFTDPSLWTGVKIINLKEVVIKVSCSSSANNKVYTKFKLWGISSLLDDDFRNINPVEIIEEISTSYIKIKYDPYLLTSINLAALRLILGAHLIHEPLTYKIIA